MSRRTWFLSTAVAETRFRVFAVIVTVVLIATACGGADESVGPADDAAAPVATDPDNGRDAGDGGGDGNADEGDDANADGGDVAVEVPGVLSEDDCLQAGPAMAVAFSGGFGYLAEPGDIAAAFDQLAEVAPSEIAADLEVMGDTFTEFYTTLRDAGVNTLGDAATLDDPAVAQTVAEAAEALDADAFKSAAASVDAWFATNCGPG